MRENRLRTRLASGGRFVTGWLTTSSTLIAEAMANSGFEAMTLDMQHGAIDVGEALPILQAISSTPTIPLVRVPWNDPAVVMKVLDLGAYGVICPMIEGRADTEAFVRACRYPPQGFRSYGPTRAALYGGGDYAERANDTILAIAMIETLSALDGLDEVLSVPGLDAVFVGPADISQALGGGRGSDWREGPVVDALDTILERCRAHGVPAGIYAKSAAYAREMLERGFGFVAVGSDVGFVAQGSAAVVDELRATVARP